MTSNTGDVNRSAMAAYASDAARSRGRLHAETPSAHRSAFHRDRDRILHAQAFRRLKHKTQVFVEHEGDYYRTRLTHSLEVAQVARTIARSLGLNQELTEAVALAHDLGHTPFGHTGEDALHAAMAPYGGFDHNAQAIRIVTQLEAKYAEFDGLNLTWECLEAIAKHNGPVAPPLHYALAAYNRVHDLELATHASAEAQVAAISDDVAYNNHDLDDGLRAGLFTLGDISDLPLVREAICDVDQRYPGLEPSRRQHESLRRVFGAMVEDVIVESTRLLERSGAQSVEDIRALGGPVVRFSAGMFDQLKDIRAFLFERMYRHASVMEMRVATATVVSDLFAACMGDPALMPTDWADEADGDETARARVVSDYISGMTDRYALQKYEVITGKPLPLHGVA